jgi:hypothetical protein
MPKIRQCGSVERMLFSSKLHKRISMEFLFLCSLRRRPPDVFFGRRAIEKRRSTSKTRQTVREATADFMILDKVSEEGRCILCILVGARDDTALN